MKNDKGCLAYSNSAKYKAWKSHYERLINVEFLRDSDSLPDLEPKTGSPLYITEEMISKDNAKMKPGKAAEPSRIVISVITVFCCIVLLFV